MWLAVVVLLGLIVLIENGILAGLGTLLVGVPLFAFFGGQSQFMPLFFTVPLVLLLLVELKKGEFKKMASKVLLVPMVALVCAPPLLIFAGVPLELNNGCPTGARVT